METKSLNLKKLIDLVLDLDFVPTKFYVIKSKCKFIEISSKKTSLKSILKIPKKYSVNIESGLENTNVIKLSSIEISESDDKKILKKMYDTIDTEEKLIGY